MNNKIEKENLRMTMTELSKTAWKFRDRVKQSKVVPYKIRNSWWLISGSVCRECSSEEAAIAKQLWPTFAKMEAASYEPNDSETAELKELYDQIQKMDVGEGYTDSTHADAMEALLILLQSISDSEIEDLIKQLDKMPVLIDYVDGCSYRHRSNSPVRNDG